MHSSRKDRSGFTLIELLVVIAILAVLFIVVLLVLNPAQLLMQARDSNRIQDLATLSDALNYYSEDTASNGTSGSFGTANTVSLSIPDPSATSTAGDQCQGLGMPPLPQAPSAWSWDCAAASNYRNINATGWIPVNFNSISVGSPIGQIPQDPTNTTSSHLYYSYATNGSQYELTDEMESTKYIPQMSTDGGGYDGLYQAGTDLNLTPPVRSYGLIGWWPLTEGSGTTAYDSSGSGDNGTWFGTQASPSSTYYATGLTYPNAGYFDGSADYVVNSTATINYSTTFSISAWFETTTSTGAIAGGHGHNFLRISGSKLQGDTDFQSGSWPSYVVTGKTSISNSVWHLGVFVVNGLNLSLYLDGKLDNTANQSDTSFAGSGTGFYIGQISSAAQYFQGQIADVRIYNRVLSAAEIAAIYNAEN